jgi:hypothetical protein
MKYKLFYIDNKEVPRRWDKIAGRTKEILSLHNDGIRKVPDS